MKCNKLLRNILFSAIVISIFILFSIWLFDRAIALWIMQYLTANTPYLKTTNIKDHLMIIVVLLTSLSWLTYLYLFHQNIYDRRLVFCSVIGTVLPLSFAVKTVLKWLFGRTETQTWLQNQNLYQFHWFSGTNGFEGFPSGHMLVFTPLFLTLWHFYPRYRLYYGGLWLLLGVALVVTEYHFLSDVIVGSYIGILIYLGVILRIDKSI